MANRSSEAAGWLFWTIGLVSAATLAFEIALMRVLLIASWHHFAFLIISIGLLGFGVSGTVLILARSILLPRGHMAMPLLALCTALSMPVCQAACNRIPVEARIVPALLWSQTGWWVLYWTVLTIPFLLGATTIGLGLLLSGNRVASAYAANLVGSGIGVAAATLAMWWLEPAWLAASCGAIAMPATWLAAPLSGVLRQRILAAITLAGVMIWLWICPPRIRPDPFKYSALLEVMAAQHDVRRIARRISPRGVVEVFQGEVFHELPFLSLHAIPPPLHALVIDGQRAGSILHVGSATEASTVDHTMMSVPYQLLEAGSPEVLLLGERGGANVWLAHRMGAATIHAVQSDPTLWRLLPQLSPALLAIPGFVPIVADPRQFVGRREQTYDLIQIVSLEGMAAGSGGVAGLGQDYLITVEGLASCLRRLREQGMLCFSRGIQTPPRDNLKLLATVVEALQRLGLKQPDQHVVIVRDYLAVCTMVKSTPWSQEQVERVRRLCRLRQLTPVWFAGIRLDELNQPDHMPGPPGSEADWYYHAAGELFGPDPQRFISQWLFDIRAPTDDRPFFLDFCRLRAVAALREAFGDMWLTRAELAFVFVLSAMVVICAVAFVTLILPLLLSADFRRSRRRLPTTAYFAAIGLGYLMLEMMWLSRLTQLIGDPVLSAATTITTFLLGSGVGSMLAQRMRAVRPGQVAVAVAGIALFTLGLSALIGPLADRCAQLSDMTRMGMSVALMLPPAVLMGMPMPAALRALQATQPQLIPWAWGVNGFASVLAAPLGIAIAMSAGFSLTALVAILLYLAAAALFPTLSQKMAFPTGVEPVTFGSGGRRSVQLS